MRIANGYCTVRTRQSANIGHVQMRLTRRHARRCAQSAVNAHAARSHQQSRTRVEFHVAVKPEAIAYRIFQSAVDNTRRSTVVERANFKSSRTVINEFAIDSQ